MRYQQNTGFMRERQGIFPPGTKTVPFAQLEEFLPVFLGKKHQSVHIPRYSRTAEERGGNSANHNAGNVRSL